MYHPLVYMTTECHHRASGCTNRFCAFYHNEKQKQQALENREELKRKIEETTTRKTRDKKLEAYTPDITSPNQFPKLPTITEPPKSQNTTDPGWKSFSNTQSPKIRTTPSLQTPMVPPINDGKVNDTNNNHNDDDQSISNPVNPNPAPSTVNTQPSTILSPSLPFSSVGIRKQLINNLTPLGVLTEHVQPEYNSNISSPTSPFASQMEFQGLSDSLYSNNTLADNRFNLFPDNYLQEFSTFSSAQKYNLSTLAVGNTNSQTNHSQSEWLNDYVKIFRNKPLVKKRNYVIYEGIIVELGEQYPVIIKDIQLNQFNSSERKEIIEQIEIIKKLNHRNIISYRSTIQLNDRLFIVMEKLDSLENYFKSFPTELIGPTPLCISFIHQLCTALLYLHSNHILHQELHVCYSFLPPSFSFSLLPHLSSSAFPSCSSMREILPLLGV